MFQKQTKMVHKVKKQRKMSETTKQHIVKESHTQAMNSHFDDL